MARNPDSVVDISLDFDTTPAENSISNLGKKVAKAFNATGQGDPLATLNDDIKVTEKNIDELKKKLASISKGDANTPYTSADVKEAEDWLKTVSNREFKDTKTINAAKADLEEMRLAVDPTSSNAYQQANADLQEQENILEALRAKVEELKEAEEEENRVQDEGVDVEHRSTRAQRENIKSTQKQSKQHKSGLVNILKYALGIRTLYTLVSKVKSAMKEGITWVGNYSKETKANLNKIKGSFNMIKASIGAAIAPIINALTPVIEKVAQLLTTVGNGIAKFMAILTGQKTVTLATKNLKAYVDELERGSEALGAYDKLNVIDQDKGNTEGANYFETVNVADLEKNKFLEFAETLRKFFTETLPGYIKKIKEWWDSLTPAEKVAVVIGTILAIIAVIALVIAIAGQVKKALGDIVDPVTTIVNALEKVLILAEIIVLVYAFKEVIEATTGLITAFAESNLEWYDVLLLLVSIFGVLTLALWAAAEIIDHNKLATLLLIGVLLALAPVLDSCANLIKIFSESGLEWYDVAGLLGTILAVLIGLFASIILLGPAMTAGLLPFIAVMVTLALTLDPILSAIGNFIVKTAPALEKVIKAIGDAISLVIKTLGTVITDTLKGIKDIIDSLTTLLNTIDDRALVIVGKIVKVGDAISDLIDDIKTLAKTVSEKMVTIKSSITTNWNSIYNTVSSGVNRLRNSILTPLVNFIKTNVFDRILTSLNTLKINFKNTLNIMIGYLQTFVNAVVNAFNNVISAINSIGISVPSWVPNYGGRSWYPNLSHIGRVNIPKLATGAVLPPNAPFLALLGDQKSGTNIEAPLDTIKQALAEVMANTGSQQPIVLQLDGKTVAKVVWNESEKRYKQTGKSFAY